MARRLCINYVSPAICEGDTSGSGFGVPIIVLEPFGTIPQVGGLVVAGEFPGPFTLNWTPVPGALCYNIYQVVGEELVLVFECVPQEPGGVTLPPGSPGGGDTYVVTPITPEGEGPPSLIITTPEAPEEPPSDFWHLQWQLIAASQGNPAGGFASSFNEDRFDIHGVQPLRDPDTGTNALQDWEGTMIYTGGLRPSHIRIFVSQRLGNGQFFQVEFFRNGVSFFSVPQVDLETTGTYDADFDVPTSVGDVISCRVVMVLGAHDSPTSYHWDALLT